MQGLVFSLLQICILLYKVQVYKLLITLVTYFLQKMWRPL